MASCCARKCILLSPLCHRFCFRSHNLSLTHSLTLFACIHYLCIWMVNIKQWMMFSGRFSYRNVVNIHCVDAFENSFTTYFMLAKWTNILPYFDWLSKSDDLETLRFYEAPCQRRGNSINRPQIFAMSNWICYIHLG